jgi:ribonuclease PH
MSDLDTVVEENEEEDVIGQDDFIIVIGPDGELKNIIFPNSLEDEPPEEIQLILHLYGIDDIDDISDVQTVH